MSRLRDWLVSAAVLLAGRGRAHRPRELERIVATTEPRPRSELAVVFLLLLSAAFAAGVPIIYALDPPRFTQVLGASLGLSLAFLSAALIVAGSRLIPDEQLEEDYPEESSREQAAVAEIVEESSSGFTRKKLLGSVAALTGGALGVAFLTPAVSLGPVFNTRQLYDTPWRRGRRLVDENGKPIAAGDVETKGFYTAYPEGADREELGSPLVVVRLDPRELALPAGREDWAPEGILAFSKICTHAGCAISLYRVPTFEPVQPEPALVCPCHYSTFDPATGGSVLFGPAGRPLPQLPLLVDQSGDLRAAGNFDQPIGPSWWGVRLREPT